MPEAIERMVRTQLRAEGIEKLKQARARHWRRTLCRRWRSTKSRRKWMPTKLSVGRAAVHAAAGAGCQYSLAVMARHAGTTDRCRGSGQR